MYRIRSLLLNATKSLIFCRNSNTALDDATLLVCLHDDVDQESSYQSSFRSDQAIPQKDESIYENFTEDGELIDMSDAPNEEGASAVNIDGSYNVTSFVAFKLQGKVLDLGTSSANDPGSSSWTPKISRWGSLKPTDSWLNDAAILEQEFVKYHGESDLDRRENVIKGLSESLQNKYPYIHPLAIRTFIHTRTLARIRHLNRVNTARVNQDREERKAKKLQMTLT